MSTGVQTQVGQFIWHDLLTTDVEQAKRFYTELLGWEIETWKPGEVDYPMIKANGQQHGGFGALQGDGRSHWIGHVFVEDLDRAVAAAQREGGTLRGEPDGHSEVGSWATIVDPEGAEISAFKPSYDSPAPDGVFLWDELHAQDVDRAKSFYRSVFGWTAEDMDMGEAGTYTLFKNGDGENVAGLFRPSGPSQWVPYLAAEDVDATFAEAKRLGAQSFVDPIDVETVGRFAVLADPTGATFGLYKRA